MTAFSGVRSSWRMRARCAASVSAASSASPEMAGPGGTDSVTAAGRSFMSRGGPQASGAVGGRQRALFHGVGRSFRGRSLEQSFYLLEQAGELDGLGVVVIAARLERLLPVARH